MASKGTDVAELVVAGANTLITNITPTAPPCELFDDFGVAVQLFMAFLAFSSLIYKRHQEFPQRPLRIWFLDTSKQGIGNMLAHLFNSILAVLFGDDGGDGGNACSWYLVNIILDTTLGLFMTFLMMKGLQKLQERFHWSALDSGFYGHPPSIRIWLRQVVLWLLVVFLAKAIVALFTLYNKSFLATIGSACIYPFRNNPKAELLIVMLLLPFILNVICFWIMDNLLKKSVNSKATAYWITYDSLDVADEQMSLLIGRHHL